MTVLSDEQIAERVEREGIITPFVNQAYSENQKGEPVVSYGLSSYGYDIRIANTFKVFTNVQSATIDPKNFDDKSFQLVENDTGILIPPNSFALGHSIEWIKMPRDLLAICLGKSTYARCGIVVNVTPIEPEWEGNITIEISNTTPLPAKIYPNEGVAQLVFLQADTVCAVSYADRKGKYQGQTGVTLPKVGS